MGPLSINLIDVLAKLAPLGSNVLLLGGLIVVFMTWRRDQERWEKTLEAMLDRYAGLLEKNAQVLERLAERLD